MSTNKSTLYPLIQELKQWKNGELYAIVGIKTDGLDLGFLYKDQYSSYTGNCYIQKKNIPPSHIWVEDKNI